MIKGLFGFKIWVPIMLVFIVGSFMWPMATPKQVIRSEKMDEPMVPRLKKEVPFSRAPGFKSEEFRPPAAAPDPPPPPTTGAAPSRDWLKDVITYGGGLSVLVNLINLLGKISAGLAGLYRRIRRKYAK